MSRSDHTEDICCAHLPFTHLSGISNCKKDECNSSFSSLEEFLHAYFAVVS